jgi:hypothetical protein
VGETAGSEAIFVRAIVDNPNPYLYEQVTYRVRLYTLLRLLDNPGYTEPATQGFWRENLPPPEPSVEVVDGKRYTVLEVAVALFPTTPGDLSIGEAVLKCTVRDPGSRRRDPFSLFGGSLLDGKPVTLRTKPMTVTVESLPPDPPPGYTGTVGEYRLEVRADRTEVPQGEPITLTVELTGTGHLRTVGEVDLPDLPNFRSYPSQADQEITRRGSRIGGRVTKQFVLVPLTAGEHTIPPVELVTFSPREGRYVTLRSAPLTIHAAPASVSGPASRGDIELLGRDIRFIETDVPEFRPLGTEWSRARQWLLLLPAPAVAYGALWLWERRRRRLGADAVRRRRQGAASAARSVLKGAKGVAAIEQAVMAGQALRVYLADRYDLPRAGLTPDRIERHVAAEGIEPRPILAFLDACDAARYAPGGREEEGQDWIHEARGWIERLERSR